MNDSGIRVEPIETISREVTRAELTSFDRSTRITRAEFETNREEIWFHLLDHLKEKPSMKIKIHGYHTEFQMNYTQQQITDGYWSTVPLQNIAEIDDFRLSIDLSSYIDPDWQSLTIGDENLSIRTLLENYARSTDCGKELRCDKEILGWNFDRLTENLRRIIHSSGYRGIINVNYSFSSNQIIVRPSARLAHITRSILCRPLCFPLHFCRRASNINHRFRIVAEYRFWKSFDEFIQSNCPLIVQAWQNQSEGEYLAL